MVGAGVVLALGEVDAGLAAVGGVDLGDEGRRDLDHRHPALVGVGAEAGQVADHAAAEGDEVVLPGHPGAGQLAQHRLGSGHRLRALAGVDLDPAGERLEPVGVERADDRVGDAEAPAGQRPPAGLEQAPPDVDRVGAGGAFGPDQPRPGRELGQGRDRGNRRRGPARRRREDHRVGELLVERQALGVERAELGLVAGQRAVAAGGPPPGVLGADRQPDDDVAVERVADPLGEDAAAAERDRAAVGALEQRADDLGLALPERRLAVALEELGDRRAELALEQLVGLGRLQPAPRLPPSGPATSRRP